MAKITYLFGAGASFYALPIVKYIPEKLQSTINYLSGTTIELNTDKVINKSLGKNRIEEKTLGEILGILVEDLNWLLEKSEAHASIDTFAKKLTIINDRINLTRLKHALSAFFTIIQIDETKEKRYDSFFASLLNSDGELPKHVRVLSWNYDFQFEKAYSEYSQAGELKTNRYRLNVLQKNGNTSSTNDKFSLVKLNGSCTITGEYKGELYDFCNDVRCDIDPDTWEQILSKYFEVKVSRLKSSLSFAWEEDNEIIDCALRETKDTEILVVIGYSFPYFNRDIDRKIIGDMSKLKKVYFQSPEAEALKDRFSTIRGDEIQLESINDTEQFLLPSEL